jgi:hypothetical protein
MSLSDFIPTENNQIEEWIQHQKYVSQHIKEIRQNSNENVLNQKFVKTTNRISTFVEKILFMVNMLYFRY